METIHIGNHHCLLDDYLRIEAAEVAVSAEDGHLPQPHRLVRVVRGDAAAVLLIDRLAGDLLLVEQFRWPTHEKGPGWLIEIVAGMIDPGETPVEAAQREALEEAGRLCGPLIPVARCYPTPGYSTERCHIFAADVRPGAPDDAGGGVGEHEDTRLVRLPFHEVPGLLETGRIEDAKTLVALQWFLLNDGGDG